MVRSDKVLHCLRQQLYQLVLATTDDGVETTLRVCANVKAEFPETKLAIIALRNEYIPNEQAVDVVIREQYSPGRFLAIVKKLMEAAGGQSLPASTGK